MKKSDAELYEFINKQDILSRSLEAFLKNNNSRQVIEDILKDILNLYNASRTYIFIYVKELNIQRYQYEAVAENADPQIEDVGDVGIEETPYLNNLIKSDLPFIVNRLDEIKDIAPGEYAILKPQRVKSLLIVPLLSEKEPIGYIRLDIIDYYRTLSESDFQWLKSISSIITLCS